MAKQLDSKQFFFGIDSIILTMLMLIKISLSCYFECCRFRMRINYQEFSFFRFFGVDLKFGSAISVIIKSPSLGCSDWNRLCLICENQMISTAKSDTEPHFSGSFSIQIADCRVSHSWILMPYDKIISVSHSSNRSHATNHMVYCIANRNENNAEKPKNHDKSQEKWTTANNRFHLRLPRVRTI